MLTLLYSHFHFFSSDVSGTSCVVCAGEASQGKEGQRRTEISYRVECAPLPAVSPVLPTPSCTAAHDSVSLMHSVSLQGLGQLVALLGAGFQLHLQQQLRNRGGIEMFELSLGIGTGNCCAAVTRGSARDYVHCGGAGNRRNDRATWSARIP